MTKSWDVVVLGGANFDYLVRGPKLPKPGETLQGDVFDEAPGGKGANQALAAARLGARVAFVGCVGADARGDRIVEALAREHVDVSQLGRETTAPTGVALVLVDGQGEKLIGVAPGANARLDEEDLRGATPLIQACRVLLLQLEVPLEIVVRAAEIAKAAGASVVLDTAPARELPDALLATLAVVRANAGEARVVTGIEVKDYQSARTAAKALRARGAAVAIVGAGEKGDLILSADGEQRLRRLKVEAVDSTGAGDAFAAAIAVALAGGLPWSEAGAWAGAAAALKTTKLGAQAGLPRRAEVLEFLAQRGVRVALDPAGPKRG